MRAVQLDAYGNVLLAAKLIYSHFETREHWGLIAQLADFLAEHWEEPDHGLWEEQGQHQYTSSKVIAACGLEYIAEFAQTDVSAALFPVWGYVAPDTPEMLATLKVLERDYAKGNLYHRHLVEFDSHQEGAFLAGTFWVAQYWVIVTLLREKNQQPKDLKQPLLALLLFTVLCITIGHCRNINFFHARNPRQLTQTSQ